MAKITKKAGARAYYTIDKDYKKIELLKRKCPRCNSLMADHYDRYACGKCGFTNFKVKDEKTKGKKTSTKAIEEVEEEEEMD